jgi:hypothetical protein
MMDHDVQNKSCVEKKNKSAELMMGLFGVLVGLVFHVNLLESADIDMQLPKIIRDLTT